MSNKEDFIKNKMSSYASDLKNEQSEDMNRKISLWRAILGAEFEVPEIGDNFRQLREAIYSYDKLLSLPGIDTEKEYEIKNALINLRKKIFSLIKSDYTFEKTKMREL